MENINTPSTSSIGHICPKNANVFCYVCAVYIPKKECRRQFNPRLRKLCKECFKLDADIVIRRWAPDCICPTCRYMLSRWETQQDDAVLSFCSPTEWNEPDTKDDCYFCNTKTCGYNMTNMHKMVYANVRSVKKPINLADLDMLLEPENTSDSHNDHDNEDDRTQNEGSDESKDENADNEDSDENEDIDAERDDSDEFEDENDEYEDSDEYEDTLLEKKDKTPQTFTQEELNDLVRNLGLPKDASEHLASVLKTKNLLAKGTKVTFYRSRNEEFKKYFKEKSFGEEKLVHCNNIEGLMEALKPNAYKGDEWRLFIDSSKRSLKGVLLHNMNHYAAIPIAHSTTMKEGYESLKNILKAIQYNKHKWLICGDLKVSGLLLGQQSGFTKTPCYLCLWDSRDRDKHYTDHKWPERKSLKVGEHNIIEKPLVNPKNVLIPPLHIKLGIIKQFVKALDKDGRCFKYIEKKFPKKSDEKLKSGIFDGPQIRTLLNDAQFAESMTKIEKDAWLSFKVVVTNFLGNRRSENYKEIVATMVKNFEKMGCLMSYKLHFLHNHIDEFPKNCGDFSDEQGERFHQDIKEMEKRYQGVWGINMMADYCWTMKRDIEPRGIKRKNRQPLRRSFEHKRKRYDKNE